MKNSIFKTAIILIALGFTMHTNTASHKVNVPEKVTTAFNKKYPQAQLKDWKVSTDGFRAEFKINHKKYTAVYAADGTWLKSATKLSWTWDMPLAVKTALRKGKYASFYEDEIKEVTDKNGITYVLTIDNHNGTTIATEGYGAWEDYRIVYDNKGVLTSVKEL